MPASAAARAWRGQPSGTAEWLRGAETVGGGERNGDRRVEVGAQSGVDDGRASAGTRSEHACRLGAPEENRHAAYTPLVALLALCLTAAALAQNPSEGSGPGRNRRSRPRSDPHCTGELARLGNADLLVNIAATADVTATSTNPSGVKQPAVQNPTPITVTASQAIPATEINNANTPSNPTTQAPTTSIPGAPDGRTPNWTATITDLALTSATLRRRAAPRHRHADGQVELQLSDGERPDATRKRRLHAGPARGRPATPGIRL
jgi:hypothetical protein